MGYNYTETKLHPINSKARHKLVNQPVVTPTALNDSQLMLNRNIHAPNASATRMHFQRSWFVKAVIDTLPTGVGLWTHIKSTVSNSLENSSGSIISIGTNLWFKSPRILVIFTALQAFLHRLALLECCFESVVFTAASIDVTFLTVDST